MEEENVIGEKVKGKSKVKSFFKFILFMMIMGVVMLAAGLVAMDYVILGNNEQVNLVINNSNVTGNLKQDIIISEDTVYISIDDLSNFFDKYIYEDEQINKVITTYRSQIAEVDIVGSYIDVNGTLKKMENGILEVDDVIYLPISEMLDVYEIEVEYLENTKILTIDSTNRELTTATVIKNDAVKSSANFISKTYDRINEGEEVVVVSLGENKSLIRSSDGKIGYVDTESIDDIKKVREPEEVVAQIEGNINLTWDYFSEYASAPQRDEKITGVNVVSPAFFYLDEQGNVVENVGIDGVNYIKQSHNNGYSVWPMVSSVEAETFETRSEIVNSYEKRKELINQIINLAVKYDLDGINMDFEYMNDEDVDMYSRLIIELAPRMKDLGLVLSVDVTAPDGAAYWSLCYDRNTIANVADYIVFMAYDQYGVSSTEAGPTAGYDWVENNVKKFITNEDVAAEKLILGVPFYTRVWTETQSGELVKTSTVPLKFVDELIDGKADKQWNEETKQYYAEYKDGIYTKKIWIEDVDSLREKVELVNQYNLAGIASWAKDSETEEVWEMFDEMLN